MSNYSIESLLCLWGFFLQCYLLMSELFKKCLTAEGGIAIMKTCNPANKYQHWTIIN